MPINNPYRSLASLPKSAAVFPLNGVILLPRRELPLNIFEPRYLAMIDDAIAGDRLIGMIQPRLNPREGDGPDALEHVGCLGRITQFAETGDGRYALTLTGVVRFLVTSELAVSTLYRRCEIDVASFGDDLHRARGAETIDRDRLIHGFRAQARARGMDVDWTSLERAPAPPLVDMFSMMWPHSANDKQSLLEARDIHARASLLLNIIERGAPASPTGSKSLH